MEGKYGPVALDFQSCYEDLQPCRTALQNSNQRYDAWSKEWRDLRAEKERLRNRAAEYMQWRTKAKILENQVSVMDDRINHLCLELATSELARERLEEKVKAGDENEH